MKLKVGSRRILLLMFLMNVIGRSSALFFPSLGMGASNCQCQTACNSAPPPMGCLCPPPQPSAAQSQYGCASGGLQQPPIYRQPAPSYPAYQPPPPAQPSYIPNSYYPPVIGGLGYAQTPPPPPLDPNPLGPPPTQVPPPVGYGLGGPQSPSYPSSGSTGGSYASAPSLQRIQLQPPSRLLRAQYMNQLMKVFETTLPPVSLASRPGGLPSSYYAGGPTNSNNEIITEEVEDVAMEEGNDGEDEGGGDGGQEDNETTEDGVQEYQPATSTISTTSQRTAPTPAALASYIPRSQFKSRNELRTTEIQITQSPYEPPPPQIPAKYEKPRITTHSGSYGDSGDENNEKVEATWTPSTNSYYTTTPKSQVAPSRYSIEPKRGEGLVGPTTADISESGYEYTGASSPLPPVTLEYGINAESEIDAFRKDVDKYHKNSGSTIPLPSPASPRPPRPPPTDPPSMPIEIGYGAARDPRHLEEEVKKLQAPEEQSQDPDQNTSDSFNEKNEIYDDLNNSLPQIGKNDYEDSAPTDAPKNRDQKDEKVSKCNNAKLKEMMHMKMTLSPSISKQMIYSAATDLFPGRNMNVICSKHSFSYIVVTSPVFCEHRKRPLTCFAFFQP